MNKDLFNVLKEIRDILIAHGVEHINLASLALKLNKSIEELQKFFIDDEDLITKLLDFERQSFAAIFEKHNFNGENAIDIMMTVSKELSEKYKYISPSYSIEMEEFSPEIYADHLQKRRNFIFEKIQINLQKGISQAMYRSDLSIELISRLYLSRLTDMQNPAFFPPEKFSYEVLFELMFDNLIRSIATSEGLKYYKLKIAK